jgi:diguanylate cyclase (GGDEF)-like protein
MVMKVKTLKSRLLPTVAAILVTVICFFAFIHNKDEYQEFNDKKELDTATDNMVAQLNKAFSYADIMELVAQYNGGQFPERNFDRLSTMALENNECVDSVELAPDATIAYVNPLEGNEGLIGHNLLLDENEKYDVVETLRSENLVVQGPETNDQGKTVIYGRKAIKINNVFWGMAIVTIDMDELIKESGFEENTGDFTYALSIQNSEGEQVYLWGNEDTLENAESFVDIDMASQLWRVAVKHTTTLAGTVRSFGTYFLLSLLIGAAAFIVAESYRLKMISARTDQLTKTLNRAEFERQSGQRLKKNTGCALLAIDLDRFKEINDTYGHLAGDEVLIIAAKRMQSAVREGDLVSRTGGDEYTILLSNIEDENMIVNIIRRLRELVEQNISIGGHDVTVGCSIGYVMAPKEGREYKSLYQIADERMYRDKLERKAGDVR